MNIALIIAGGSGNRMGQDIPKQFIHVNNCPVIVHTMLAFQKHPDITSIAVVCLCGWETVLHSYAHQYNVTKLHWIFPGGGNGQESMTKLLVCVTNFSRPELSTCQNCSYIRSNNH